MTVKKQLKYLGYILAALIALLVLFAAAAAAGWFETSDAAKWLDHSSDVQNKIKNLEREAQAAVTLRQAATSDHSLDYESARQKTLASVDDLKAAVVDNGEETENVAKLEEKLKNRFVAQDDYYSSSRVTPDGSLIVNEKSRQIVAQSASEVAAAFYEIKTVESELLAERFQKMLSSLYFLFFLIVAIILIKFATNIFAYVQTRETLLKSDALIEDLRKGILEKTQTGEKFTLVEVTQMEKWIDVLDGNRPPAELQGGGE